MDMIEESKFIVGNEYKLIKKQGNELKDYIQTITIIKRTKCYIWWKGVYDDDVKRNGYCEETGKCKIRINTYHNNCEYIDKRDTDTLLMDCWEEYLQTMGRYLPSYIFIKPQEECNAEGIVYII